MLTMEFRGGVPYLHAEKGPVGFVEKIEWRFTFSPVGGTGFIATKFVIAKSGTTEHLNKGEKEYVEVSP